jgi:CxxC motif-containing protein
LVKTPLKTKQTIPKKNKMTNNDIFKKLRVALMLRDDQIVEILELVDFRISKTELSAFFRAENHENYVECGDQVLRNFLNGLVIHLRGTKENPKNPKDVLAKHKSEIPVKEGMNERIEFKAKPKDEERKRGDQSLSQSKPSAKKKPFKKPAPKVQVVEKVKFNFGKNKKS